MITSGHLLTYSDTGCRTCGGSGQADAGIMNGDEQRLPEKQYEKKDLCKCVTRRVFNACWRKYQSLGFGNTQPRVNGICVSRPYEEFRADFVLMGRRALSDGGCGHLTELFNTYHVAGLDSRHVERKLDLQRGALDLQVAAIESWAGAAYLLTKPYALYPTGAYMREVENTKVFNQAQFKQSARRRFHGRGEE